ncbi:MAG TPA: glycosyltransferase family 2 protein [Candidatus Saccharimonadales bacterium]|nr:glycosyltransferase family 2 protein [Candidatus Saccharimonadales bacterium]
MAATNTPLVSIIILNWNRINDTLACLESVRKQTYKNYEIIVVDNGSVDDSKKILKDIRDIVLVDNPKNRGFTGGHIDGLKHAKGEFIFVLNNDAVVDKEYVKNAITVLQKDKKIAIVGGRSYRWNDDMPMSEENPFYAFQTINRFTMEGIFATSDLGFEHEVNWVSGSAMVIRKSALKKSGYFYDPMFAYYEESDLFARIQACGYSIVYSPNLKIWHKDGASSSSLFQLTSLFKNRFVFAARNLSGKDFAHFLKAYITLAARGSYHHIAKRSKTPDDIVFNQALASAFTHTMRTWPKWVLSRREVKKQNESGHNLSHHLKIEQTAISFIVSIDSSWKDLSKLKKYIETTAYHHFNSEFILVVPASDRVRVEKFRESLSCKSIVKLAIDKKQATTSPLNIGWLSASKQYVWFIDKTHLPSSSVITDAALHVPDSHLALYIEASMARKHQPVSMSRIACISRSLLALHGGVKDNDIQESLATIYQLAANLDDVKVYRQPIATISKTYSLTAARLATLKETLHGYKDEGKKKTRYAKLLERYYRLYQLNNFLIWFFLFDYSPRHKAARIYNSLASVISLNRKRLALELKHMSNEVVKSRHSGFDKEKREEEITQKIDIALEKNNWRQTPVFIICRDRVSELKQLTAWLKAHKMHNVILVDNDSAYPPLMEFLENTPYQVIRTGKNIGHTVMWHEGIAKTLFPGQFYIVSDPDVVPDEKCPSDAIAYFYTLHKKYIDYQKVGFGLQIDDLPNHYKLKSYVTEWEEQFWKNELEPNVYEAGIDTTFALYKPYTDYYTLHPSIRTGRPYTAKHLAWYVNSSLIDPEEAFYRMRASQDITSWNTDEILERYKEELKK